MNQKIISIGEILWDLLPDRTLLGGAPTNLAFRLKELGEEVLLISRVGNDNLGREALLHLADLGLSSEMVQIDNFFPTGTVEVYFDEYRNPDYIINAVVAYDHIEITEELIKLSKECKCIAYGTLAQRSQVSRNTIISLLQFSQSSIHFLDINLRKDCYSFETIEQSLNFAHILKANHHEALQLSEFFGYGRLDIPSIAEKVSDQFDIKTVLITLEENGVILFDKAEGKHYIPGHKIVLEDPLGAGDAFSAGFLKALFDGKSLVKAAEEGNLYGALVAAKKGATQITTYKEKSKIKLENNRIINSSYKNIMIDVLPENLEL